VKVASNDGLYVKDLDITLAELDNETKQTMGVDMKTQGILVKEVGSKNQSLRPNDIIIQVSSEKIDSLASFEAILEDSLKLKRDKLLLRVIREGNEFWLINPFVVE
jgi:S1-C subfamily serine protease